MKSLKDKIYWFWILHETEIRIIGTGVLVGTPVGVAIVLLIRAVCDCK